jgi:hypothetical protein
MPISSKRSVNVGQKQRLLVVDKSLDFGALFPQAVFDDGEVDGDGCTKWGCP